MGSPGENGHEGPKVTKAVKRQTFCVCVSARVYSRAAVMVFFRAELTKGMTLIKYRLKINRVRVEVDYKIVCRRKRQSLGSLDVLFSCFSNTFFEHMGPLSHRLMLTSLTCLN